MTRTHVLTGAGSGMGAVLAERLLERGDSLVLLARSTERAHDLRADLPDATVLVADLADAAAVEAVAGQLPDSLDSLVHAAGVVDLGPVAELTTDAWQSQLAVNLLAPAVLTRLCLPALRSARGTVVFVNSGAGLVAHPGWSAYAASKFGLRALADSLRAEEQGRSDQEGASGLPRSTPAARPRRCSRRSTSRRARSTTRPTGSIRTPSSTRSCTCLTCRTTRRSPT